MAETFTKLLSSITDSTIWSEDSDTRCVWVTMMAMADRNGYVGASVPGLAARSRVSLEKTEEALAKFLAPDPYSRTPDHEGRRIRVADRGWILLNYERIREARDDDARRVYERERKRRQRARKGGVPDSPGQSRTVPQCLPNAEAEAEAEGSVGSPESVGSTNVRGATPRIRAGTKNGYETVLERYRAAYRDRYGREPAITSADRSQVGRLLNGARPADVLPADWPARLAELTTVYVRDNETFVAKAGHPLRLLPTRLSALTTGPATPTCRRCKKPLKGGSVEGCHQECYR